MPRKRFRNRKAPYRKPKDIATPIKKIFDGLSFGLFDVYKTKTKANETKATLKRLKIKARIVKVKKGFAIYSRKK